MVDKTKCSFCGKWAGVSPLQIKNYVFCGLVCLTAKEQELGTVLMGEK